MHFDAGEDARLAKMFEQGLTYTQIATRLGRTKGSIASRCRKLGLRREITSGQKRLQDFAEYLSTHGDIVRAGMEAGVMPGQAKNLFTQVRRDLGWQAR